MDRINQYRHCIQQFMEYQANLSTPIESIERQLIFDVTHDHYQWLELGWRGNKRIYEGVMHLDIKNGKVWIQRNMTEIEVAEELVALGIPKEDIVLGLQPVYKRQFSEFAVGWKGIMQPKYDFSKGERGKFYRPQVTLNLPIYLEPDIAKWVQELAHQRNISVEWLRQNLALLKG